MTRRPFPVVASLAAALCSAACVESRTPPDIPFQVDVAYGPKIYLVDDTIGAAPRGDMCTRLAVVQTSSTTATATITPADRVLDSEGNPKPISASSPHNCFVDVVPKALKVDVVEVTNELFQVCVDSGVCDSPDPSEASKGQLCNNEDAFDRCPVLEVTHGQAVRFCKFIGRRLPSSIEHVIMRQSSSPDRSDPTKFPTYPNGSNDVPATCTNAVVGTASNCTRPAPIVKGSKPSETKGGALGDVAGGVYDLIGNASEWSADLIPDFRGLGEMMPWFCLGPVPPVPSGQAPQCPPNARCVYGQYQPSEMPLGIYPVCVASTHCDDPLNPQVCELRQISGAEGSLFGGSFTDTRADRQHYGIFARRVETAPDKEPDPSYGFRCVGDPGVDDRVISATP